MEIHLIHSAEGSQCRRPTYNKGRSSKYQLVKSVSLSPSRKNKNRNRNSNSNGENNHQKYLSPNPNLNQSHYISPSITRSVRKEV